jgi:hypothetical protein
MPVLWLLVVEFAGAKREPVGSCGVAGFAANPLPLFFCADGAGGLRVSCTHGSLWVLFKPVLSKLKACNKMASQSPPKYQPRGCCRRA